MRTAVAGEEPPRRTHVVWPITPEESGTTASAGGYSLTVPAPPPPDLPIIIVGVVAEPLNPGDAAELVVDPATGRGTVRRRRAT